MIEQNFDIEIKADGRWFHEGGEIKRQGLVKLFASVLSCDEAGTHWLTTPVEKGRISVEDSAFVMNSLRCEGDGRTAKIYFTDNLDTETLLSADTPLSMRPSPQDGEIKPYLLLSKGLRARLLRPVFYELAEIALAQDETGEFIYSDGQAFSLTEPVQDKR